MLGEYADALDQRVVGHNEAGPHRLDQLFLATTRPEFTIRWRSTSKAFGRSSTSSPPPQGAAAQVQRVGIESHDARKLTAWSGPAALPGFGEISANFRRRYRYGARPWSVNLPAIALGPRARCDTDDGKSMVRQPIDP